MKSIFFLLSIGVEILLARHRKKEKRFGPSPANNYTSGSGRKGAGLFGGGLFAWRNRHAKPDPVLDDENQLPAHAQPGDVRNSYNTEATAVAPQEHGTTAANSKHGESGYGYNENYGTAGYGQSYTNNAGYGRVPQAELSGTPVQPQQRFQSNPYRYDDGVYNRT